MTKQFKEEILAEEGECGTFCEHGGYCIKLKGHTMPHTSGFCSWEDDKSLSKERADNIISAKIDGKEI